MSDYIFQPTQIVLAKVKGYSPWPSMIIPEEIIPANVMKSEYVTQSDSEDTDTKDPENFIIYSDILSFKKFTTSQEIYCVKFFCDDSYRWVKHRDLSILTIEDCRDWLDADIRKNKKLIPAYEMALKGLVTDNAIDVWEFVEYGSQGKDQNDDEYVEYEETSSSGRRRSKRTERATRSSSRQRSKRQKFTSDNEEDETTTVAPRRTRSKKPTKTEEQSLKVKKQQKTEKSKPKPKPKMKEKEEQKPKDFNYENDEDWSLVGMGPQDLSITKHVNSIVKKLSQKKNIEKHNDLKSDIQDMISSINGLLSNMFINAMENDKKSKKNDLEIILDEMDIAIGMRGPHNEFITTFISNNELLFNFRLLFNLKGEDLKNWSLYNNFQRIFKIIYGYEFLLDSQPWSVKVEKSKEEISTNNIKIE
ncbi:hypothetical protein C6P45_001527 [Maudiozyma exigua]|uniref:PWWP domain-containing protein n=1 Tax=Maudiozyma exigua TaxID=34358 RepID=A0A9P6W2I5_MAUEX|nr:hypothetical protein C6P45_001527 [Kazachstania exigua]